MDRALALVVEAENTRYSELWGRLSPHQRLVLTALHSSGGTMALFSEYYRRQYRLGPASSVQRSIKTLLEQALVGELSPGEYRISDAFLRAWIARLTRVVTGEAAHTAVSSSTAIGTVTPSTGE